MTAKSIRTRHFRGNEELEWISDENNYDFNFQTFRPLKNMIKIMPKDHITTECVFNTSSRNKAIIVNNYLICIILCTIQSNYSIIGRIIIKR